MSSGRTPGVLFNATGAARRLRASPLLAIGPARPGPALCRGALVAVPIGLALGIEFGFDEPTIGAIATGALLAGFPGLDAPAGPRAAWQAASTPAIGVAAALGVLSSQTTVTAVLAIVALGALAGYCFAISLRMAIVGLSVTLAMVIAQGLFLDTGDALPALGFGLAGGLLQVTWSLLVWRFADRAVPPGSSGWSWPGAVRALRENLSLRSPSARHAIRFGLALGVGVLTYRLLGLRDHGFWIPLTILFVMRPERDETDHRLILRALGTALGLVLATAVAETLGDYDAVIAAVLTVSAALAFGLLAVQYALFTAAITTYVVLLSDTLGERAFDAAGQRASGTALGILIAFLAFVAWPNRERGRGAESGPAEPSPAPPPAPAR